MQTEARWKNFLTRDDGNPVALARFLDVQNVELGRTWVDASRYWIEDVGGERIYVGDLDAVPGRSALSFNRLLIEEYPSRTSAIEALSRSALKEEIGLRDSLVVALNPTSRSSRRTTAWIGKTIRFLRPIRVVEVPEVQYSRGVSGGEFNSDEAQITVFYQQDQWQPFTMVNLNGIRAAAQYPSSEAGSDEETGREAYRRYARNIAIEVFRRGGNFLWMAKPVTVLVGDSDHPLGRHWSQFVLVGWPSRMAFRHLISDKNFIKSAIQRDAGLEKSIAIPGKPWPEFSGYAL